MEIYQLKIMLMESKPPIWRRILVKSNINLEELHEIIQIAMGWTNSHLHQFIIDGIYYGIPDPEFGGIENATKVKLNQVLLQEKDKIRYEYDFGDCWQHKILLEKIQEEEKGQKYPYCLKGKRACPPEDCGGVYGYEEFLETIGNPKHPDHKEMLDWVGGDFDPNEFSVDEVNQILQK